MNRINRIDKVVVPDHNHDSAAHRHKLRMRHRQFSPIRQAECERLEAVGQSLLDLLDVHTRLFPQ